ncbi:MAG: hypothetical protein COZ70_01795 [Deltaproteobacteria bacterium CG_4_8_14_3_um_filter_51_11]|nr:MAG: hypothetical protein AUK25_10740 [Desulfobacteraceae bacterium CG2_30_51_40]PIP44768.1 MAG: hypothetical protein COX16_16705 [Deltaproteobacteria bacterium CG23_combo_of_CG06-09_8_20_14_all_51_20]PIX20791.1 MAG: hypothetical protein COZ70_01795 [Deltaproteobacteria bacterium CG_4_8_14_3_um_filter_51_11]PIY23489.1 MAG: hypothetical protein COZ11_09505 [Deltaproteobacteria bacterium CG_4_10_14_3_um_filter_51_14]PJB38009.1 MAG: hypothetical protein CO107_03270 [Deltaproteobacteria bacteriu
MKYDLRFLPEVEEDAIAGYHGTRKRPMVLERNFLGCSTPAPVNLLEMPSFIKRCMVTSAGVFSDDFPMQCIFELKMATLLFLVFSIALVILGQLN